MNIIDKKYWYFALSILIIIPGIISLVLYGLRPSIDFTGGSRITFAFSKDVDGKILQEVKEGFAQNSTPVSSIQPSGKQVFVRTAQIDQQKHKQILSTLGKKKLSFKETSFETIGPTVSREITGNAIKAVLLSSFLIVLYIAWAFRKVPYPASSWRFASCTIIALLHDVLVVVGVFSLLGHFFNVEVDSLFITAVLTVIGFSVHDTIVVFDRIRENLRKSGSVDFARVVNDSILQTLGRSLNTSLTVLLVLLALLLFGGETIKWFVVALLVGITSGTYSSIFNAAPLLVVWHEKFSKNVKSRA